MLLSQDKLSPGGRVKEIAVGGGGDHRVLPIRSSAVVVTNGYGKTDVQTILGSDTQQ